MKTNTTTPTARVPLDRTLLEAADMSQFRQACEAIRRDLLVAMCLQANRAASRTESAEAA